MPFDGSGNFIRAHDWTDDATAKIKIRADRHDEEDDNFRAGLSMVICRDGQSQVTADIPFNGHKLTGVAQPTAAQDAATKAYADAIRAFNTAINLSGTSTGAAPNQVSRALLGFVEADMAIVGRNAGSPEGTAKRIAINDKADGTGADLVTITETGQVAGAIFFIDRYYNSGTATWTKPTLADNGVVPKYIEVWVQGGGGGGGGAAAGANVIMVGSGGGGGAYSHRVYSIAEIVSATVSITIGAAGGGGPGTPGTPGGSGGQSSFGGLTAGGGNGGTNTPSNANDGVVAGASGSGVGANADEVFQGSPGQMGIKFAGLAGLGGAGGAAGCGNGGSRAAGSPGQPGVNADRGAGGNGGYSANASGGSGGGAGGLGFVHVREWY